LRFLPRFSISKSCQFGAEKNGVLQSPIFSNACRSCFVDEIELENTCVVRATRAVIYGLLFFFVNLKNRRKNP
jgi:hypothetical protein